VSFTVDRGEVVGFLGPNGAGKTTTMRMLSCFLPPSAGRARLAGFDVVEKPFEVRRRIGYMPENVPLYGEMRVGEYLAYRANLKGVPARRRKARVGEVIERCGLGDAASRIIGQLSKGYRQRVGLAESLVHDPEILILDEPTIGLDPNQIRHVRALIRSLASDRTVILSTHILPEVEMTCGRVIILHEGRIVASDTPDALSRRMRFGGSVRAEIRAPEEELRPALEALQQEGEVRIERDDEWCRASIPAGGSDDVRARVFTLCADRGWTLRELTRERLSLEEIFVQITREENARAQAEPEP
jgi:ABC-2 type transport system ATP-binding protein